MKPLRFAVITFKIPIIVLLCGIVVGGFIGGVEQALVVGILAILEISLSFDNAVINATILRRLNVYWQRLFMTAGMVIAVVGMRLLFPVAIVVVTAGLSFSKVLDLIVHSPQEYAHHLEAAHPAIAAFGGIFLLMIFLDFLLDEAKVVHWIERLERPLARHGRLKLLSTLIALGALMVVSVTWGRAEAPRVISAGLIGLVTYTAVRGLSVLFERIVGVRPGSPEAGVSMKLAGRAAFFMFIYLEVLDASFSFDGVVGAFAITSNVLTIGLGLGIGALFVRELTLWLVRHDTLSEFIYLEHGAHYAVGALALLLGASLQYVIPDAVTGVIGAVFVGLALVTSWRPARVAGGTLQ